MERESFVFYRSFKKAIDTLPYKQQLLLYRSIVNRALDGIEPTLTGATEGMYKLIAPQIEANERKFLNGCKGKDYGKKGGRPTYKEQEKTPPKPQANPKETPRKPLM